MSEINKSDISKINNINNFANSVPAKDISDDNVEDFVYSPTVPITPTEPICPTEIPDEVSDESVFESDNYLEVTENSLFMENEADDNSDEIEISKHEKGTVKNERYLKGGEVYISDETEYDENGNIIRHEVIYNGDGGNYSEIKEYDNKGHLIRHQNDNDGDGRADYSEIKEYNENGNLIREENNYYSTMYNRKVEELVIYDSNGNLTRLERDYNGDGIIDKLQVVEYDDFGNKISKKLKFPDESIETTYKYNDRGEVISQEDITDWDNDGNIDTRVTSEKYENGNEKLTKTVSYRKDGSIYKIENREYDENGKKVKETKTYFDENENITSEFQYEIDEDYNYKEIYISNYNEEINYSKQGYIGDCWLLAGINTLSYSEAGRQILKDAVTRNEDGSFSVYFKGIDTTIKLEEEEIKAARKSGKYSKGDDDMLVFELAFEAANRKIQNGEINIIGMPFSMAYVNSVKKVLTEITKMVTEITETEKATEIDQEQEPLNGGNFGDVVYMLTGKYANWVTGNFDINMFLHNTAQRDKNLAIEVGMASTILSGKPVVDIYGNEIYEYKRGIESHGFSVKSVDKDTAVIVNPWDSSIEYVVSLDELASHALSITYIDLNQDKKNIASYNELFKYENATGFIDITKYNVVEKSPKIPRENRND